MRKVLLSIYQTPLADNLRTVLSLLRNLRTRSVTLLTTKTTCVRYWLPKRLVLIVLKTTCAQCCSFVPNAYGYGVALLTNKTTYVQYCAFTTPKPRSNSIHFWPNTFGRSMAETKGYRPARFPRHLLNLVWSKKRCSERPKNTVQWCPWTRTAQTINQPSEHGRSWKTQGFRRRSAQVGTGAAVQCSTHAPIITLPQEEQWTAVAVATPVSYTHLTLPTIYSV